MDCDHCGKKVTPLLLRLDAGKRARQIWRRIKLGVLLRFERIDIHQYAQRMLGIDARPSDGYKVIEDSATCMFCGTTIPEEKTFMRGLMMAGNEVHHSKSGVCETCIEKQIAIAEAPEKPKRPMFVRHLRIDIEYYRDGHLEYRMLRPDERKRNQLRNRARLVKWKASGRGIVHDPQDDEDELRRATYYIRGPLSSIAALFNHDLRAWKHDLETPTGARWLKRR